MTDLQFHVLYKENWSFITKASRELFHQAEVEHNIRWQMNGKSPYEFPPLLGCLYIPLPVLSIVLPIVLIRRENDFFSELVTLGVMFLLIWGCTYLSWQLETRYTVPYRGDIRHVYKDLQTNRLMATGTITAVERYRSYTLYTYYYLPFEWMNSSTEKLGQFKTQSPVQLKIGDQVMVLYAPPVNILL